ncbi:MAG: 23S rRNA (uracil(1939)-C(5))-methyltransferase RlmD, partial [Lachnospiraceae bacterium]|nr:23S rRNA (uracil(1939)-C(5))-methyltransferase RlmD [Lachnospiraceae bacterium]
MSDKDKIIPYEKNQELTVEITEVGSLGEGVAKLDGYALFVKDSVRGDICQVKIMKANKSFAYAKLLKVITPSPYRVKPRCEVARRCGGCKIMAADYKEQLRFKTEKVYNNLTRIGGASDFEYESIIGMEEPYNYRNKAQFPIGYNDKGRLVSGFYAGRTHVIVENNKCFLGVPENEKVLTIIKKFMNEYSIKPYDEINHTGVIRHVMIRKAFHTGEIMVCIVINGDEIMHSDILVGRLKEIPGIVSISISINKDKTNVIMGRKIVNLFGRNYIRDYIKDVEFNISPKSFFQVNPIQTEKLYEKALEYAGLTGNEVVWDLYCGIGTISLFLARNAKKVYGVEIISDAIEDAKRNAKLNNIDNTEFFVGKSEEVFVNYYKTNKDHLPDVVVVDPPRKGCERILLEKIASVNPEKIVYVSCDSATLGRDVAILEENGYKLLKACPVDMFPHTE